MFYIDPNQLTPEEQAAVDNFAALKESQIQEIVVDRMLDPDYVISAIESLVRHSATTRMRLANLIMGRGDKGIHIANLKLDCMDWLRERVKEGE